MTMTIKEVLKTLHEEFGVSKVFMANKLDISKVYMTELYQGKKLGSKKMKRRVLELTQKYNIEIEEVI
ncbi:hypothetical protein [Intestinibacter sp.]